MIKTPIFSPDDPIRWTYPRWFRNSVGSVTRYGYFVRVSSSGLAVIQINGDVKPCYVPLEEIFYD